MHDLPEEARRWEIYVPLHELWVGYMQEILGLGVNVKDDEKGERGGSGVYVTAQSVGSKLASADFHGAEVEVVRSRCVGRVGARGIVVRDTKFTFEIVTPGNELKSRFGPGAKTVVAKEGFVLIEGASYTQGAYDFQVRDTATGDDGEGGWECGGFEEFGF